MDLRVRRALVVASALGFVLPAALPASAAFLHLPGKRHRPAIAANEGAWIVHAGAVQDIYFNPNKKSQPMQAYVCTRGPGEAAPRVEVQLVGRAPIEVQEYD